MTLSLRCQCGKLLDCDETYRGQPVQCPHCHAVVPVPAAVATLNPEEAARTAEQDARARAQEKGLLVVGSILAIVIGLVMFFCYGLKFGVLLAFAGAMGLRKHGY